MTEEGVWALCRGLDEKMKGGVAAKYMGVHPSGIPRRYCGLTQVRGEGLPQLSKRDLKSDQVQDPLGQLALQALNKQDPGLLLKSHIKGAKIIHREWDQLQIRDGVFYRRCPAGDKEERWQLFLPEKHRSSVIA